MTSYRFARTAAAIAAAGVVLAGCGSDDDAADATTPGAEESGEDLGESGEGASAGDDESDEETSAGDDDGGENGSDTDDTADDDTADDDTADDDTADDDTADVTVQVEIADGDITPPPGRVSVDLGDDVRIEITGDEADEAHLHGYDLPADIIPGEVAVLEFVADQAGRFELELHEAGLQLLQLEVE